MRKYLLLALLLLAPTLLFAQATNIAHGATLPVNCRAGDEFDKTSGGSEGQYRCSTAGAPGVWTIIGAGGSGNVTAAGTLTANQIVIGGGTTAVATLGSLGTTVTVLHGNAAGAPTFGAVALGSDVSGLGANVATALGVAINSPGAPVLFNGALGTPSSGNGSNLTAIPIIAGLTGSRTLQTVNTQTGASATGTTVIPMDDTIPQNGEGDEYMTLAITPTNTANKLRIDVVCNISNSNGNLWLIVALFQDSTANALASVTHFETTGTGIDNFMFTYDMTAGTTSATTFKVRAGASGAGTTTLNGASGTRRLGGALISSITITEIVP